MSKNNPNKVCSNCVFWVLLEVETTEQFGSKRPRYVNTKPVGECRCDPPRNYSIGTPHEHSAKQSAFPWTPEDLWCGKFESGGIKP